MAKNTLLAFDRLRHFFTAVFTVSVVMVAFMQSTHAQQSQPDKNDAVYMYRGADRAQRLVEKAREEGTLTWYTSMAPTESRPLTEAFEKKYGIKVELWRAANEKLMQRILTEAQSKRHTFDVIETNGTETEILGREKLLSPFHTPYAADFPPAAIPSHRLWMPDRFNFLVTAYNTAKVKREELPKTYEGFADPKWKGRIAAESGDWDWMATIIQKMGNEKGTAFFQKLAEMKPEMRKGHPLLAELIGAGEVPVGLTTFLSNVKSGQRRGSPIDFVAVQPVLGLPFGIGVAKHAPHPHAALLFADYVLSPEGQELLNEMGRLPASLKVKNNVINFPYTMLDVAASLDESEKRERMWNGLFLKK
jgi:iron(III) transport system substrate-binding protein